MDSSQWKMSLPKTYRPSLLLQIALLLISIPLISMLAVAFIVIIVGLLTGQISLGFPFLFAAISVCFIAPFVILVCCIYVFHLLYMRLKFIQEGILFTAFGRRFFTPWSNVVAFHNRGNLQEFELRQATETASVEEGLRRSVAVHEVAWWYNWWWGKRPMYFFALPRIFGEPAWNVSEMEFYVRKYAIRDFL